MNWKLKCLAFHALAKVPGSLAAHRWLQKHVTGRYLDEFSANTLEVYRYHVHNLGRLRNRGDACVLEFGAGRSLASSLLLSAAGAREIHAYDIVRLATTEHINHVIRQLRTHGIPNANPEWPEVVDIDSDLRRFYRIVYHAPGDARRTGLPPASVDLIFSTSTLEHIGRDDIVAILEECRRVCKPDGLISFIVDYHDHYASTDSSISRFNFYRYGEAAWAWFNPPNHFQNRLRHGDYERLFSEAGWEAVEARAVIPPDAQAKLKQVPLSSAFAGYSPRDLAALNGFFLLKARAVDARTGRPERRVTPIANERFDG